MDDSSLTTKQDYVARKLSDHGELVQTAYYGCIHAKKQKEYPDRLVHFAHSLREVIDLLARKSLEPGEPSSCLGKKRLSCLEKTLNPSNQPNHSKRCKELYCEYRPLSEIAHHNCNTTDNDESVFDKLPDIEDILYDIFDPQTSINDYMDSDSSETGD